MTTPTVTMWSRTVQGRVGPSSGLRTLVLVSWHCCRWRILPPPSSWFFPNPTCKDLTCSSGTSDGTTSVSLSLCSENSIYSQIGDNRHLVLCSNSGLSVVGQSKQFVRWMVGCILGVWLLSKLLWQSQVLFTVMKCCLTGSDVLHDSFWPAAHRHLAFVQMLGRALH